MVESRLGGDRIRRLQRVLNRIQNFQSLMDIFDAALVAGRHKRARRLTLKSCAHIGILSEGHSSLEMLACGNQVPMKQIGLADRFFQCKSFFNQRERFSTVESSTVSSYHFVEGKDALGFSCGALRVIQTVLVIAGLNVVIRQPLDGGAGAPTLKTFSRMPMQ